MQNQKEVPTLVGIIIIVAVAIVAFGGVFAYQYFAMLKEKNQQQKLTVCTQEAKVCPDGSVVNRTGPNCEFAPCFDKNYNHAGEVIKVYQKDGKNYLDVDFIKFLLFVDENNHPISTPGYIYGENDEKGDCKPVADPYCVVDNDKTIKSFEVAENAEIINIYYPGNLISFDGLESWLVSSPYFRLQIENNIIQKMRQIYIP